MLNKKTGLAVLLAGFAASDLMAQNTLTNYTTGDVLLCFRKAGNLDLIVDAGPITSFQSLSPNSRTVIPPIYTSTQLGEIGTNSISWSAFTYTGDNTLYMTRARPTNSISSQTQPWINGTATAQAQTALRIGKIPAGANGNFGSGYNDPNSIATAIIEEDSSAGNPNYPTGLSYHDALFGSYGSASWNGTFQGNPENTTGARFTIGKSVQRSDFYQLSPAAAGSAAQVLGYFEFNTNGVMTYVAYPSTPAIVNSIARTGNVTTINYSSGAYGIYSLRETNNLAAPVSTWPVLQTLPNNGNSVNVTDTTTDTNRFYTITAQ